MVGKPIAAGAEKHQIMLRLLAWTGCDKINSPEMRMFVPLKDSPGAPEYDNTLAPSSLKRKHSLDLPSPPDRKRARLPDNGVRSSTQQLSAAAISSDPTPSSVPAMSIEGTSSLPTPPEVKLEELEMARESQRVVSTPSRDSVRDVIQTQMSLEILLKHNELRLIDQEIAKAQVALEQLRRCTEIPYPATQQPSLAVSNGTGPSRRSTYKTTLPPSPAPWGVTDGPYARHYAQWLLPSPHFDGGDPESFIQTTAGKSPMKSRSMRGSFTDSPLHATNSARSQRSGKLTALPAGYGQPKEKATGPMILKRKSDGVQVKLVCPDCGRHDFGSAQGFINHCRIGHGRSFASHDAAAEACGEPVEYDESGAMVGVEPVSTPSAGNVHPLIRSAKLMQSASAPLVATHKAGMPLQKPKTISPDFKASTLTPHLSDLVKKSGLGIDLQEMVSSAKEKVQIPEPESEEDESEDEIMVQETAPGRHPQVAGSKQLHKPAKSPMSSPVLNHSAVRPTPALRGGGIQPLELAQHSPSQQRLRNIPIPAPQTLPIESPPADPSPISESNQAPSLVDDDEEYEPHSPDSSSVCDEHDVEEVEFEVQDDEDDEDTRSVRPPPEFQTSCATARPHSHARRPSAIRRQGEDREEKHVSFVSPSPARELAIPRPSSDRKRRRV